ncbi:MAG: bifunctional 2-C-methyl-D-erythritol 4-phosphate cytidylyltransferase/2-C-methyl-D-erythritol 2,4-cyclodiphosphate synthase [Pseudomonadota bacterium]
MSFAILIVAAGKGLRLGGPIPKQYQALGGEMVLTRTLRAAMGSDAALIQVSIHPDYAEQYERAIEGLEDKRLLPPVRGGAERAETVRLALEALEPHAPPIVLVHDAARPFASSELFNRLAEAAREGGAIAAEPVVDALWRETDGGADVSVSRAGLWRAQTPQAFPFAALLNAHRTAEDPTALDDTEVFRNAGLPVTLVSGEADNFKITTAEDMARAERLVRREGQAMDIRIGHGFDVHRFCEGDHVMLCGVKVPHSHGLQGHSDADVGLHSLADAIYGALAEGDIGTHFPPSDPQWKGAESHVFLSHAADLVRERGGRIANLDVTLLCERPKIGPHASAMKVRLSEISSVDPSRISIKATTMEKMGFVGREEGMGCMATACVILE